MFSTGIIIFLVIIVLLNVACGIWMGIAFKNLKECEKSESLFCLPMTCKIPDPVCGIKAFRYDQSGNKVCQQWLADKALTPTVNSKDLVPPPS